MCRVQRFYRMSARELRRLDSISKSPIYESFSESLNGCATIRAFQKVPDFIVDNQLRINKNIHAALPATVSDRWLAIRLEFLGSIIVGAAGKASLVLFSPLFASCLIFAGAYQSNRFSVDILIFTWRRSWS